MRLFLLLLLVAVLGFLHARSVKDEELDEINDTIVKINIGISEIKKVMEKATKIKKGGKGDKEKEKGGVGVEGKKKGETRGGEEEFDISDHIFQVNEHEHKEDDLMEGDILIKKGQVETYHGIHGDLIIGNSHYWPSSDGGKHVYIPYAYGSRLTEKAKSAFQQAVAEYKTRTCIRFIRRTNQPDFVNLISRAGCYASVGKQGGDQTVSLGIGCETKGIAIHELMHAIGYYHEQARSDRDNYVTIDFTQVRSGKENNFKKRNSDSQGTAYDYNSIMHYGPYAFAKSNKPTIKVKKRGYTIGQRSGFSNIDLISINAKYCARSNCYDIWKRCDRVKYLCDPHWFLLMFKGLVRRNCGSTCNVC